MSQSLAGTQYVYDDLGRLVLVVGPDGASALYDYDASGNVTSISRTAAAGVVVASFTPTYGPAGTQVTISGSGFDATPALNTVTIGGAGAVVSSATDSTLVVTVPLGADTGPVAVTVAGNTGTSAQSFTVFKPEVTSVSPLLVDPGTPVTVTGANLDLAPGSTSVSVGATGATITSLSNTQAVFTAPTGGSGHVTVSTSYGQATSSSILTVVPPGVVTAANVVDSATAEAGGAPQSLSIDQQNKYGLLQFDATAGEWLTIQVTSLITSPSGANVNYQVYSPTGATFSYGTLSASNVSLDLPKIPASGSYFVTFASGSGTSVEVTATIEVNQTLDPGASLNVSTTVPKQNKRFIFSGTAGQSLGLAVTGLALMPGSPNYSVIHVYQPNGYQLTYAYCYVGPTPGCALTLRNLPETGDYVVRVDAPAASTMAFGLTLSEDAAGTLEPGTPLGVTFGLPGQQALLSFTATANETVALNVDSIALSPSGKPLAIYVYGPTGTQLGYTTTATSATLNLPSLAAGTHTVLLAPQEGATGSAQVTLASGLAGTLPTDGTSQSFSSAVPGQNGYFTFAASAGDDLGLALTNLVLTPSTATFVVIRVFQPDGYQLMYAYCYTTSSPGCALALPNVPETGTYVVRVDSPSTSTMAFALTLSEDVGGTLSPGTPIGLSLDVPGRQAALTFTAAAGQTVAVSLGAIGTTPTGKSMTMRLFTPGGGELGLGSAGSSTTQATVNLTNLSAGTYTLLVVPQDAATGAAQVTLADALSGTIPTDGSAQSFSSTVPGQNGYFTFDATAGDSLALALTNLVLTPTSTTSVRIYVTRPDGYGLGFSPPYCYTSATPGCPLMLFNLPMTGTYKVDVVPQGMATMTFDLTITQDLTGSLSSIPLGVTFSVPGQEAALTFTATAGQSAALTMSSITTTPSGKSMTMRLFNTSGTEIGLGWQGTSTTEATVNLSNLQAGTYTVVVVTQDAATGSVQVRIQ